MVVSLRRARRNGRCCATAALGRHGIERISVSGMGRCFGRLGRARHCAWTFHSSSSLLSLLEFGLQIFSRDEKLGSVAFSQRVLYSGWFAFGLGFLFLVLFWIAAFLRTPFRLQACAFCAFRTILALPCELAKFLVPLDRSLLLGEP